MLYTFGFTVFLLPYEIVTGGIAGIGAIIFYATKFPVQWTFFIINAILIVAALKELGLKFLAKTIYATIALTVLLELAQKFVDLGHIRAASVRDPLAAASVDDLRIVPLLRGH